MNSGTRLYAEAYKGDYVMEIYFRLCDHAYISGVPFPRTICCILAN
jgi:hypothetical protein